MEAGGAAFLSTLGIPLVLGGATMRALGLTARGGPLTFWSAAYLCGCFCVALLLQGTLLVGAPLQVWLLWPLCLLVSGGLFCVGRCHSQRAASGPLPAAPRWERCLFALALGICVLVVVDRTLLANYAPITTADESVNWAAKAKVLYQTGQFGQPYEEQARSSQVLRNPDYPLFNPLLQLWAYVNAGKVLHYDARIPLQAGILALLFLLADTVRRHSRPAVAAGLTLLVLFSTTTQLALQQAAADALVATCLLLVVAAWLRYRAAGEPAAWRLFCVGLTLLAWTKNEGLMLALLTLVLVLLDRKRSVRQHSLRWLALGCAVVTFHFASNAWHGFENDLLAGGPDGPALWSRLPAQFGDRWLPFTDWLLSRMWFAPRTNQWLIAAFLLICLTFPQQVWRPPLRLLTALLIGSLIAFLLVYAGSYRDLDWHLDTSGRRVLFQLLPTTALWLALAYQQILVRPSPPFPPSSTPLVLR
jgi:hypothetical protein